NTHRHSSALLASQGVHSLAIQYYVCSCFARDVQNRQYAPPQQRPPCFARRALARHKWMKASFHHFGSLAPVAHRIEHLVAVQGVAGSIPAGRAKKSPRYTRLYEDFLVGFFISKN